MPEIQRLHFLRALEKAIGVARSEDSHLGMLLIDLTNLSRINHNHGYEIGDRLLGVAHEQLLSISKLPNAVFRVGSHSFAFILPGLSNPAFIALAVNKVTSLLNGELFIDTNMIAVDLKVGIAINHQGSRDAMAMLALAESSLGHVKLGGDLQLEELLAREHDDLVDYRLEHYFGEALRDNDFRMHFQPKVNLVTGQVESAEALLRWTTQDGTAVSPEVVVALAESTGRSFELTKWVIHRCLRQLRDWREILDIGLALNVQAGLVGNPDLPALLEDATAIWGADPGKLTVEITEDAIIEDKEAGFNNLMKICEQGINLSIDDFGTGYSSLSYFKHIPAAELKIDKTFVKSLMTDEQDLELVKIMISIAHKFGLRSVAEGIEDEASMVLLRNLGCDYGQGYFFTPPLATTEFEAWMRAWRGLGAGEVQADGAG